MLKHFIYNLNDGPLASEKELLGSWDTGNCRRIVQYYTFVKNKIFLKPEEVLCPEAYNNTGTFVIKENKKFSTKELKDGDIIYAEKIRNKSNELVNKSIETFASKDDYIIFLHKAIFTGEKSKEVWHATFIEGSSCFWSLEKFLNYYRPVAVKRI